ncbi:hypothetical protein HDV00_004511 [Rhizophlyctis rosea]|nr:hypothetical protein HDV00_004511 [Rhizophlyctis rosea]
MFKLILLSLAGECTFALIGCLIVILEYKLPSHPAFAPLTYGTYFALAFPFLLVLLCGLGEWGWKRHKKARKGKAYVYDNLEGLEGKGDDMKGDEEADLDVEVPRKRKWRFMRERNWVAIKILTTIAIAIAFSSLYHTQYPGFPSNMVPAFQKLTSSTSPSPFPPTNPIIQQISQTHSCCFYDFTTGLPTDPSCPFQTNTCATPWPADPFPPLSNGTNVSAPSNGTQIEPCNCYHVVQHAAFMHIIANQLTLYVVMLIGGPVFWCMGLICGSCR